ncbi:hypothetical protein MRB53_019298 [Persea americana]|uniref:Uncharacterized protein n=1 Tax=Persea americana TaxID=3435 RepID=A0ACC2KXI8_PERAE|nr:hypothetical protein MRB53_019298 [Persea americana]
MAFTPEEIPQTTPPSISLQIAGFLTGNTIHVQGDAGDVRFSGQFDIHQPPKTHQQTHFPGTDSPESPPRSTLSIEKLFSSITQNQTHGLFGPSPITDTTTPSSPVHKNAHSVEFSDLGCPDFDQSPANCPTSATQMSGCEVGHANVTTRLRSGVISPVTYFPCRKRSYVGVSGDGEQENWRRRSRSRMERRDVLERVLREHSFPVRPCNSYTFFVMTKWRDLKSSSFQETSKRLGEMWSKLPNIEKKEFVKMALKDNERYKKQCMLLKRRPKCLLGGSQ